MFEGVLFGLSHLYLNLDYEKKFNGYINFIYYESAIKSLQNKNIYNQNIYLKFIYGKRFSR